MLTAPTPLNTQYSTPNTPALNAVTHGIFSRTAVLPGVERQEDWDLHFQGLLESLAPATPAEGLIVERIASTLWRLARVARYETGALTTLPERVESAGPRRPACSVEDLRQDLASWERVSSLVQRLPSLPDEAPLLPKEALPLLEIARSLSSECSVDALLDAADEDLPDPFPAGLLRHHLRALARQMNEPVSVCAPGLSAAETPEPDLAPLLAGVLATAAAERRELCEQLESEAAARRAQEREALLPREQEMERVMRYEAHLNRTLTQSFKQLRDLQHERQQERKHENYKTNPSSSSSSEAPRVTPQSSSSSTALAPASLPTPQSSSSSNAPALAAHPAIQSSSSSKAPQQPPPSSEPPASRSPQSARPSDRSDPSAPSDLCRALPQRENYKTKPVARPHPGRESRQRRP
jgi:hypothetical protein